MILAGGGMVVGNQVSALLADRFKPGRFTCYLQFLAAAALLLTATISQDSVSFLPAFLLLAAVISGDGTTLQ